MEDLGLVPITAATGPTTRSLYSFFDEPRFGFNLLSLSLAALGVGLGLWALWLAYNQLRKTLNAAEAARKASEETAAAMRQVAIMVDAVHLSGLCGQLLHLLRDQNWDAAAIRLQDLRVGVAELSAMPGGLGLQRDEWWVALLTRIRGVQNAVEVGVNKRKMSNTQALECISMIGEIEADLRTLTAKAAHGTGA